MTMRSPIVAMLWEIWRVTRVETAWRLALGIVGGFAALALGAAITQPGDPPKVRDFGAVLAMVILAMPHFLGWLSLARLNGGRPGFPLYLLYTRPVRTAVIVGLPMAYLAAVPAAVYLLSALLLRLTSGYPFPLLSVAAWLALLNLVLTANNWSARKMVTMALGSAVVGVAWMSFAGHRLTSFPDGLDWYDSSTLWPTIFNFPLTDYASIALIGLASFGVAVARVGRQRRGHAPASAAPWTPGAGLRGWLINLFRFPCPTSSATRAQVWFDLKYSGLPLLTIGVALAIVTPLLFTISIPVDAAISDGFRAYVSCADTGCFYARPLALLFATFAPLLVLIFAGNAFGIHRKQGRTYVSAFEATQAYGTAQLVGLKLLVRSVCVLAALTAVAVSIWTSLPILGDEVFLQIANVPVISWQRALNGAIASLAWYELLALAVVGAVGVVVWVAAFAVIGAIWTRYSRRVNVAASLLLLSVLVLALLALARRTGFVSAYLVDTVFEATRWAVAAAVILAIVYLVWSGFAERVLTARYASGALMISAAFGAAWLTVLQMAGVQLAGMSLANTVSLVSLVLLPLMASVLAPWSLSRIRHL